MPRRGPSRSPGRSGLRALTAGAGALLLTGLFVLRGFPSERLAAALCARVSRSTPLTLQIAELAPSLSLLGPGVRATDVRLGAPDGVAIRFETLRLRPAWSLDWLLLRPTFRVGAELAGGSLDGTLAGEPSFRGGLAAIDLAQLPVAALWPGGALAGTLDAEVDVRAGAQGPEGSVALDAREGRLTLPRVPLPLPFATLNARLSLGGDAWLRVEELRLSGPGLEARVQGSLAPAASFAQAPLDLRVELTADPALRAGLRSAGVRVGNDGQGRLRITGTPERPVVQ